MPSTAVDAAPTHDEIAQHARLQERGYVTRAMFDGPRVVLRVSAGVEDPLRE